MVSEQEYTITAGVSASDIRQGNVSVSIVQSASNIIKSELGTYSIMYRAVDDLNNVQESYRTVIVTDIQPPSISLNGNNMKTIQASPSDYNDNEGVSVDDNYDSSEQISIVETDLVNNSVPGTYEVSYYAKDRHMTIYQILKNHWL